jgi:hypothetical protein
LAEYWEGKAVIKEEDWEDKDWEDEEEEDEDEE